MTHETSKAADSDGGASASTAASSGKGRESPAAVERARDRSRTMDRIITAVGTVLAEQGFQKLGINAIARQAGVDKVLIYRYFDGLAGLMEAYAKEVNFWPMAEELAGYDDEALRAMSLREQIIEMMKNLARSLHRRPATQQVIAWELVERNELTASLEQARWAVLREFVRRYIREEDQKANPRLISVINFAASAVMLLVARGQKGPIFEVADLSDDAAWQELDAAITNIVHGLVDG